MLLETKKKLTYMCIAFSYLLTGIQYAIIFPSLNLFIMERYSSSTTMFGVIISAYNISGIFSGQLFGYIVDRKKNSKTVVFLANITNIIGNVMYMLGISPLFLIFSRLICGIGSGAMSAMVADVTRSSTESELTSMIAIMMAFQEFGLVFGPVFALVLKDIHFYIGQFLIDNFTSPGLVMAVLYSLLQLMIPFLYFNLSHLYEQTRIEESVCYGDRDENFLVNEATSVKNETVSDISSTHQSFNDSLNNYYSSDGLSQTNESSSITSKRSVPSKYNEAIITTVKSIDPKEDDSSKLANSSMSAEMIESAERYITSMSETESVSSGSSVTNYCSAERRRPASSSRLNSISAITPNDAVPNIVIDYANDENRFESNPVNYKDEYLRDEIIVLLGLQFIAGFSQSTLETIITPFSKKLYDWSDLENAEFFLAVGIFILVMFVIIKFVNRLIGDRNLMLCGIISIIISYVWLICFFIPTASPGSLKSLPHFVVGAIFDLIGLPILMVSSPSLMSKLTSKETQAYSQGIRRSCMFLGFIIGPLWGGSTVHIPYLLFSLPLAVLLVIFIMFILSYKKLKIKSEILEASDQKPGVMSRPINM